MVQEHDSDFSSVNIGSEFEDDFLDQSKSGRGGENPAGLYEMKMARSADKWVLCLRLITACVLVSVAVTVCLAVYFTTYNGETAAFESNFEDLAEKLVLAFEQSVKDQFEVIASFNDGLTSEANGSWPFFTPPDFSERFERTAKIAKVMGVHFMPLVKREDLDQWNDYSVENFHWRPEGIARERDIPLEDVNASMYVPYTYNPWAEEGVNHRAEDIRPDGPYFPIWLSYPVSDYAIANLDLGSDWEHIVPLRKILATGMPIFEYTYDYVYHMERDFRWEFIAGNKYVNYQDDPHAVVLVPVFDKFGDDKQVVAVEAVYLYWRTYFDNLLPPGSDGIVVVLENTCNQTYTYQIDGSNAEWIGQGDDHDPKYDYLEVQTSITKALMGPNPPDPATEQFLDDEESDILYYDCYYNIRVYPSQQFEDSHRSDATWAFAIILAALFLFVVAVYAIYDFAVERRQHKVMQSALQSGALVSSLFPEEVRKQLYQEQKAKKERKSKSKKGKHRHSWEADMVPKQEGPLSSLKDPAVQNHAIARLYPETSIFFSDFVGFTQWSSDRTPESVFQLLETIYGAFDKIAHRRKVFKVETIGDCYVAVTGLPNPQEDHAVILCKFATACMSALNTLTMTLADELGEDTRTLSMRVGIHSGKVTAGVLRGEKARFQLFGDSVNVASRMESNGVKNRIHVSQDTANALIRSGKGAWLEARGQKIVAKGKGEMQTYFVNVRDNTRTMSVASDISGAFRSGELEEQDSTGSPDLTASDPTGSEPTRFVDDGDVQDHSEGVVQDHSEVETLVRC